LPIAKVPDAEFVQLFETHGPEKLTRILDLGTSNVLKRRRRLEAKYGRRINGPAHHNAKPIQSHPSRLVHEIDTGICVIAGDGHYWPGEPSTMHRALVALTKELKPKTLIIQGDVFDGARVSRHPSIGWAKTPTVQEEIEVCQERLDEIARAGPRGCRKMWSLGNHDGRFESKIANQLPELAKVHGTSLKDHFPIWEPCWGVWVNDRPEGVVVKHRFTGGMYAPRNNTLRAGRTMVTGHLHSAKVMPHTDYNGTRWGVDTGCIADPDHAAFEDYTEASPKDWRSAFCILSFKNGRLLWPELVTAFDRDHVQFRGEIIAV
jgi:hypothetical protein